jgi:protein involved in plasmid replication-relaxation
MVTDRDLSILRAITRYYVLNRQQIQRLVFPEDTHGRITRRRLQSLIDADLLSRQPMLVSHPSNGAPAPVYYPSPKGNALLAEMSGDDRFLVTSTQQPTMHHVWHWLAVSETHITFDKAIRSQDLDSASNVQIAEWFNEYDIVNPAETLPEKRFRLYSLLRTSPRLICAPDAAFLLATRGHSKVFYLEQDRATTGVHQIAASKAQGYAVLSEVNGHRRHFPESTVESFTVLMVAPNARRRDALRKVIGEKRGASLWRFASQEDVKPEKLLFQPIWYPCDGEPESLIKPNPLSEGESSR